MSAGVLLRVDAGPGIGLGHLQRCLALAAAFEEARCRVSFLVNDDRLVTERARATGRPVKCLGRVASWSADDAAGVIAEARCQGATIVIVDSDLESPEYIRRLRDAGLLVCAVEDLGADDVAADIVLNGDAHAESLRYRAERESTVFLLGPMFTPLSQEYWTREVAAARVPPTRVLLTLGGGDASGIMPVLLREAVRFPASLHLDVVAGPFTSDGKTIEDAVARFGGRATLHHAPGGLFSLIEACDVAVTAAGQTLYELAALGRPAVAIEVADNQHEQLAAFERKGAVLNAGVAADADVTARAIELVIDLAGDSQRLGQMAIAGRRFIDGQGARRAAAAIVAYAANHVHAH